MRHVQYPALVMLGAVSLGCGPSVATIEDVEASTTQTSTVETSSRTPRDTTSAAAEDGTSSAPSPSSTVSSTATGQGDSGCSFLCPEGTDTSVLFECSTWLEDCPIGEKCSPWSPEGNSPSGTRCVPIYAEPDGPGESCTAEGFTGLDSCTQGSFCWDVDVETEQGTCASHCVGSEESPACLNPDELCTVSAGGILALCLPSCDPLEAEACEEGDGCYPVDRGFICAPDASGDGGGLFEPCEFTNGCDAGLSCAGPNAIDGCEGSRCCTSYCDLGAPQCPASTECTPYFGADGAPPGFKRVGACLAG